MRFAWRGTIACPVIIYFPMLTIVGAVFSLLLRAQASGCPHELWKSHGVQAYVDFLTTHRFNAVRLPLSAALVNSNAAASSSECGGYSGQPTLDVLDDVLTRLRDAGIFAVLDIHTLSHPEQNEGLWCGGGGTSCTASSEEPLVSAWTRLAQRYCASHPNVIGADL